MQVFIIGTPLETAQCLDTKRLNRQIQEAKVILDTLNGKAAWENHPCTIQYREHTRWLQCYLYCLKHYKSANLGSAVKASEYCEMMKPSFHTEEYFDQMKRRLYTKMPEHYNQWEHLGESDVNWYFVDGEWRYYRNGKRIEL